MTVLTSHVNPCYGVPPQNKEPSRDWMRQIAPARQRTFTHYLETCGVKYSTPIVFESKLTSAGATLPLAIVGPANRAVPQTTRNIFVNYSQPAVAQNSRNFVQDES